MIRVALVDDHAVVREGYRRLLESKGDISIVGEAGAADEGYALCLREKPDVLLLDLSLGQSSGLNLLDRVQRRLPETRVLVFSMHLDAMHAVQALRSGALGYVTKSSPASVLAEAVYQVAQGKRALSPDIAGEVTHLLLTESSADRNELTPREFDVLRLLMQGLEVDQIAEALHISPKTVRNTHYQLKARLGAKSDIELTKMAIQMALVEVPPTSSGS